MPIGTHLCINGSDVWDNQLTQAYVDRYECETNRCQVQLQGCICGPRLDPNTVDILDAPWFCADDPNSTDFLGIYMLMAEGHETRPWDRTTYDPYCPDGQCGGTLGPLRTNMRVMTFTVMGVGVTCAGAAYGKRWLQDKLQGDCGTNGRGLCPYDIQISDCCTPDILGAPRTWEAHNAGVVGPVEFENVCDCLVWRATFEIVMQPYFFDCITLLPCDIFPAPCGDPNICITAEAWAARYTDLCSANCNDLMDGIPFPSTGDEVFTNQLLNDCGHDPRVTPCEGYNTPSCLALSSCSFSPPKPVIKPSACAPCISSNISDWGECCTIDTLSEEVVFDIEVSAGQWDVFGVNVAIFDACPANNLECLTPVWEVSIPQMNAFSTYTVDGIDCTDTFNCSGIKSRGSKIGASISGASILACGTYFASVRYSCLDECLTNSPDFLVTVTPKIRRASL